MGMQDNKNQMRKVGMANGVLTRELIVLVSSVVVCTILLSFTIFYPSTYGSWINWVVKAAKNQRIDQSQGMESQPPVSENLSAKPRQVFIKASSVYWGNVSDLTKPEVFYSHKIRLTSPKQSKIVMGDEVLKDIKDDLRRSLRKFEKQNNVKVVWDAPGQNCPDVTAAFIEFFDKECQQAADISPFAISLGEEQ